MRPTREYNNLSEALNEALETILSPGSPKNGSAIIREFKEMTGKRWTDAAIRYHLSMLAKNPSSPVRRFFDDKGIRRNGYVLRTPDERPWGERRQLSALDAIAAARALCEAVASPEPSRPTFWAAVAEAKGQVDRALENFDGEGRGDGQAQ
jgi:hypothetical protein